MERALALPLIALALAGCGDVGCGNKVTARVSSPDGHMDAVVFTRDCGATTVFSTQLSVVSSGQLPEGSGNLLVLDGSAPLKLSWSSSDSLSVSGLGQAKVFHEATQLNGVEVSYGK